MGKLFKINSKDNVSIALSPVKKGEICEGFIANDDIPLGHKIALCNISCGESVIKYGFPIGEATCDIKKGSHVHSHNLHTLLADELEYTYSHRDIPVTASAAPMLRGYRRADGSTGIRNEIYIIPLVGCVNKTAEKLALIANERFSGLCDGVYAFTHPYGCSQLGDDHETTRQTLAGLCRHPNAAGVLLLSLGCENNTLDSFLPLLGNFDKRRIKTLVAQDCCDEIAEGTALIKELSLFASEQKRTAISASELIIGMKCGGSDAFSGITANPLCGAIANRFTSFGARVILTETPEMFGAETVLMERAASREIYCDTVKMINGFKKYFACHNQPIYENPSPGNKEGGITTLEEKSLGCIQKGGTAPINAVIAHGARCTVPGLNLLPGPGNDLVSCTNLAAVGAHIILFTTGRGTPLGTSVPTIKISSNSALAERKPGWIDYDAGQLLCGKDAGECEKELEEIILAVACGAQTKSELNGCREIAIFKDGVTL